MDLSLLNLIIRFMLCLFQMCLVLFSIMNPTNVWTLWLWSSKCEGGCRVGSVGRRSIYFSCAERGAVSRSHGVDSHDQRRLLSHAQHTPAPGYIPQMCLLQPLFEYDSISCHYYRFTAFFCSCVWCIHRKGVRVCRVYFSMLRIENGPPLQRAGKVGVMQTTGV